MPGKKRSINDFPTPTITEFEDKYVKKALARVYVRKPYLNMRDAALLVFEFLFKARVSECLGRTYGKGDLGRLDVYRGITLQDFEVTTIRRKKVLRVKYRILKRGHRKKICKECNEANTNNSLFCRVCGSKLDEATVDYKLNEVWEWSSVEADHQLVHYILEWLKFLLDNKYPVTSRVWDIGRTQAWRIMRDLGIMNHTQRHWRATQLADTMDPFELKEALHRATIPSEYVHRAESRRLNKEKKADKMWH